MTTVSYTTSLDKAVAASGEDRAQQQIERCLAGKELIGESFNPAQLERWYREEAEAYRNLGYQDDVFYPYDALNSLCGYRQLGSLHQADVLGIGSAHGREFAPLASRIRTLTIIESDTRYYRGEVAGVQANYLAPGEQGQLPVPDASADLVTCFGVLHHVARVSVALREIGRVLKPGGVALIREPIVSMGDWRQRRPGLTKNERGIPVELFRSMMARAGLIVMTEQLCGFAPLRKAVHRISGRNIWSSRALTRLDLRLSRLRPDVVYHPRGFLDRVGPSSVFYRVTRP